MAGTVKLPGLGEVKTGYVIAGGAVVLIIVGYAYYRHRSSAAAAGSSTAADTTAAIDPQTGYPEGSPQDIAALTALEGGADDGLGTLEGEGSASTGAQMYYDPADGLYDLTSPYTGGVSTGAGGGSAANTGPGTFTSNAMWLQYAEENITGYTASQIQGALSAYLAGVKLTTTQYSIYQVALGVAGPPPDPPATPPVPAPPGTTTASKPVRNVADGLQSLDQVAKSRNTTAAHIISVTEAAGSGIDATNLARFKKYVAGGTSKKMPAGLVYYTTNE